MAESNFIVKKEDLSSDEEFSSSPIMAQSNNVVKKEEFPSEEEVTKSPGQPLADFLSNFRNYVPTVPDAVCERYLHRTGASFADPRVVRLISLAAQKFMSDITNDALQYCKVREAHKNLKPKENGRRYVLTMEDLTAAVAEKEIVVKKPEYFV